jgi:hypothetical protein
MDRTGRAGGAAPATRCEEAVCQFATGDLGLKSRFAIAQGFAAGTFRPIGAVENRSDPPASDELRRVRWPRPSDKINHGRHATSGTPRTGISVPICQPID